VTSREPERARLHLKVLAAALIVLLIGVLLMVAFRPVDPSREADPFQEAGLGEGSYIHPADVARAPRQGEVRPGGIAVKPASRSRFERRQRQRRRRRRWSWATSIACVVVLVGGLGVVVSTAEMGASEREPVRVVPPRTHLDEDPLWLTFGRQHPAGAGQANASALPTP